MFGSAVAASADTVVVGATGDASAATTINGNAGDVSVSNAGGAYVFARTAMGWSQQAYLKPWKPPQAYDQFAAAVGIDGDLVVVGAPGEDSGSSGIDGAPTSTPSQNSGAVFAFRRTNGVWARDHYLKPSTNYPTSTGQAFGTALSLRNDALLVGAQNESGRSTGIDGDQGDTSVIVTGAAHLF
jgi:hypothetical protein